MIKNNIKIIFRLVNIWCAFIMILLLLSYLPHWPNISYHSWLNSAFYILLFLLAVYISLKEKNNKDIFINLATYLLVYSLSVFNIFMGDNYLLGGGNLPYYYYHYKKITFSLLLNHIIIYPVIKYLFVHSKKWFIYFISLSLILSLFLFNFHSVLFKPDLFVSLGDKDYNVKMYKLILANNLPALAFILFYGYLLYKNDKILGKYINHLMACFFIILLTGLTTNLSNIFCFKTFNIGQYVLTINLIFMCTILFKKLFFINSEFGQFYEALIHNKITFDKLQIKRHRSETNAFLIKALKIYISQRRIYLITLMIISCIIIGLYNFPRYFTLISITILFCVIVLFWFVHGLYKRRAKKNYIIS